MTWIYTVLDNKIQTADITFFIETIYVINKIGQFMANSYFILYPLAED